MLNRILLAIAILTAAPAVRAAGELGQCRIWKYNTAANLLATKPSAGDCTIGYALDTDLFYLRSAGAWGSLGASTAMVGENGGTWANGTNNVWTLGENSEDLTFTAGSNLWTLASSTGATFTLTPATTISGDLTLAGGAGALTFTDSASSIVVPNNDATALVIGGSGLANLLTLDTTTSNQKLMVTGTTTATALHVDVGTALFDELVTIGGGAGAITTTNSAASHLIIDNDTSAFDWGSTGLTGALRYSSEDDKEVFTFNAGVKSATVDMGGGNLTLDASDCGKTIIVDAGDDSFTTTLPATIAGCEFKWVYVGADGGALLDISPNASDGIYGGCTLAASVVTFSGTDDADVGITKDTINKGDMISIIGDGVDGWVTTGALGICANN